VNVKRADEFIPWTVTDISLRPYKEMWSFNPSIHFDGQLWRCVLRCSDYAMPEGTTIRSSRAKPGQSRTKNAMVIFDPVSWRPVEIYKMRERDELPRASSGSVGYEDVRIFRTDQHGLQGIAASLHLRRTDRRDPLAEQVLLSFDEEYNVVDARPIRGSTWGDSPQKNWVPFDHCAEPRFLYAIDKGVLFDAHGELRAGEIVRPSRPRRAHDPDVVAIERAQERAQETEYAREREQRRRYNARPAPCAVNMEGPSYEGLRGGTQLVRVDDDSWLAVGHAMTFVNNLKYYWHVWYLVDACGKLTSASPPMKLVDNGIEFAAGLAVDGERVVVSFGVDDMECRIGETKLSAVIETLRPVESR
jgi:hypothetical protein